MAENNWANIRLFIRLERDHNIFFIDRDRRIIIITNRPEEEIRISSFHKCTKSNCVRQFSAYTHTSTYMLFFGRYKSEKKKHIHLQVYFTYNSHALCDSRHDTFKLFTPFYMQLP